MRIRIAIVAWMLACLVLVQGPASAQTLERLRETGVIRLGVRADAAPFVSRGPDQAWRGFTLAICRAVATAAAEAVGRDLRVELVETSAERRFEDIEQGRIDLSCGPDTITLERRKRVEFSIPWFADGLAVMTQASGPDGIEGLRGAKAGVRRGTTAETTLRGMISIVGTAIEVVPFDDHSDGVGALNRGEIAAYFADRGILLFLALTDPAAQRLRISENAFTIEAYGLPFRRGDLEFRDVVDATLARLFRTGEIDRMFAQTVGPMPPGNLVRALWAAHGYLE